MCRDDLKPGIQHAIMRDAGLMGGDLMVLTARFDNRRPKSDRL
jgi:hypothetical protein